MFSCVVRAGTVTYRNPENVDKNYIWADDKIIMQPFNYAKEIYDIDYWRKLSAAFNKWIKAPENLYNNVTKTFEDFCVLFNVWNDICENRSTRNGKPTTHNLHGLSETLTSTLFVATLSEDPDHKNTSKTLPMAIEAILEVNSYLMLQVKHQKHCVCPTEEVFQAGCSKFSNLLKAVVGILQQDSSNKSYNFDQMIEIVTAYYLIARDYKYFCNEKTDEDALDNIILENFPYPLIHVINNYEDQGAAILDIIRQRSNNPETKKWVVYLIKKLGGLEHTRNKLQHLRESAAEEVKRLGNNPLMDDFIANFMNAHLY